MLWGGRKEYAGADGEVLVAGVASKEGGEGDVEVLERLGDVEGNWGRGLWG